ncbi:ATP-binding cassette domain-containing protein [Mycobacterium spongiae]|uniref:ATP-binding cassette domain-containing protein n=1 Tax=Mycobacterium spongiae TaxID=886343 RepID=A0A975JXA7_9MYCO|nr:ATP-binding cassette domain-containing protein [Mycobacterium spongiae]QUR67412.1 ATP-binding cassette domain-containing protein [Mycobacterium spongiae]
MRRPAAPVLTIRHDGSQLSFAASREVVIGRDINADVFIPDPRISRTHLIVRFDQDRWLAIDNGSVNGTYVNGYRTPVFDIHDGQSINVGNPEGPLLTFEIEPQQAETNCPPQMRSMRDAHSPTQALSAAEAPPNQGQPPSPRHGPTRQPTKSPAPGGATTAPPRPLPPTPKPPQPTTQLRTPAPPAHPVDQPRTPPPRTPTSALPLGTPPEQRTVVHPQSPARSRSTPHAGDDARPTARPEATPPTVIGSTTGAVSNLATRFVDFVKPRSSTQINAAAVATIGRAADNDIVVSDVLASRQHATLVRTPLGTEIRDNSINGTFVNGTRVGSAIMTEDDEVTIGNVDFIFRDGTLVRSSEAATRTGGLQVRDVRYVVDNGKQLLDDISLTARPGTLTAIVGGSGAGKSTLARLIAGYATPTSGSVSFEGHDIHADYASLRSRIGMVPQDDVVHRQLTVNQALSYAAELRLPPDTSKADRAKVVADVLEELDLTKHADTRVDKLSGGQRKRASVALEMLTGPSLLILDEPTSGLDPALDCQVMTILRRLADAGRVVIVVTHMLSYLDVCDQLLLVAPGGKTAYCGPPDQIGEAMGTTNWAKIFTQVGADPEEANRRFLARSKAQGRRQRSAAPADEPAHLGEPVHTSLRRQISTIARRQVRLVISDRAYFVFLALLPFIMGALALTVPGSGGFQIAAPDALPPDESAQLLALLLPAAGFMGTALTIRDLVGERAIFQREQAVGLSTTAYLLAKTSVFCGFAILQSAIVTAIVVIDRGAPTQGAVVLGHSSFAATFELFMAVAATCVASALLGLAISSLVRSSEQIMPLFVVAVMAQLVLCGGTVPVTDRFGLDQMSIAVPSRWGYAAAASTVDLNTLVPDALIPDDKLWQHTSSVWLLDMSMLVALSLLYGGFVRWKIRLAR